MAALRSAAKTVSGCLTRDEQQIPDPWDLLQSSYSRDYQAGAGIGDGEGVLLEVRQVHVIPDILLAQYEGRECRCFMGLFAEIGRAWMSVNNRLFLWEYTSGRDLTCFEELDEVIIGVALVRPKENIFVPAIRHLLVVMTASEMILLGVAFHDGGEEGGDLVIHRTGLVFPTDEVNMLAVLGTRTGRIFAGGQDGHIYEFDYQAREGWFTRRCRKISRTASLLAYFTPTFLRTAETAGSAIVSLVYDQTRNLLHALAEDSSLQVFHLGGGDEGFERLSALGDLYEQTARLCPASAINRKTFKLVAIHVVEPADSVYVHLIGVTASGLRLYFTTLSRDQRAWARSQLLASQATTILSPAGFELLHVRLPSDETHMRDPRKLVHRWTRHNIHTSLYSRGVTLTASAVSDQEDAISAMLINQALAMTSQRSAPMETVLEVPMVEGKVWDISEIPSTTAILGGQRSSPLPSSIISTSSTFHESVLPDPHHRRFLLLSNTGLYVLCKGGPTDELQRLLREGGGSVEGEALRIFFETYSAEQACFFAISLACSVQRSSKTIGRSIASVDSKGVSGAILGGGGFADVALWAVGAMLRYGGEPRVVETTLAGLDPTRADDHATAFGSRVEYEFSALHRGLYLYLARLMGSIWHCPISRMVEPPTELMMCLHAYAEFLSRNPNLMNRTPHTSTSSHQKARFRLEEAYGAENESIRLLQWLVQASMELLAFLSICRDYGVLERQQQQQQTTNQSSQPQEYQMQRSQDQQSEISRIDFEELLSTPRGRVLVGEMGRALVQRQLRMRSSVDSLCQVLLQRCPLFFGEDDAVVFQASEALERALQTRDPHERALQLIESLRMFTKGAAVLTLPLLADIARKYQRLAFFPGIIELALAMISQVDPQNIALLAYQTPTLVLEPAQQQIVTLREGIYALIFDALRIVHGVGTAPTFESSPSPMRDDTSANLWVREEVDVEALQKETLARAIRSRDELFHNRLYEWLIAERLTTVLLEMETPFLQAFLRKRFVERDGPCQDLLWKHQALHGHFLQAAQTLFELALSPDFPLSLADRIERLSLALGHARSAAASSAEVTEFIQDLEERLDVANVQLELLEQLLANYGHVAEEAELNSTLYSISELFNRFARPLHLPQVSLRILHCAGYQDALLVHRLWQEIIDHELSHRRFSVLAQRITQIAHRLYPSPYAFPLNFVLDSILQAAISASQPPDWVATTFLSAGIPAVDLLQQLHEFTESRATFWGRPEHRIYLLSCTVAILNSTLDPALLRALPSLPRRLSTYIQQANSSQPVATSLRILQERLAGLVAATAAGRQE